MANNEKKKVNNKKGNNSKKEVNKKKVNSPKKEVVNKKEEIKVTKVPEVKKEEKVMEKIREKKEASLSDGAKLVLAELSERPHDAEELMLDAFAVAASGTSRFSMKSSFKTWLFAIGRNLAMKHLRKNRIDAVPLNEALYRALEQLSPEYRQALYLIYFEDMDNESAAKVMGKNRKQFYNLTSRGKAALKGILERMGFEK